jgi:hypothetical protein
MIVAFNRRLKTLSYWSGRHLTPAESEGSGRPLRRSRGRFFHESENNLPLRVSGKQVPGAEIYVQIWLCKLYLKSNKVCENSLCKKSKINNVFTLPQK